MASWVAYEWLEERGKVEGLEGHHLLQQQLEILPSKPASPFGNPNRPLPLHLLQSKHS